jgi:hypothetical protein
MMRDWILKEVTSPPAATDTRTSAAGRIADLQAAIERVIRGKSDTVKFALIALPAALVLVSVAAGGEVTSFKIQSLIILFGCGEPKERSHIYITGKTCRNPQTAEKAALSAKAAL